jgi:hypothetical protein
LYHEADSLLALLKADTARLRQALPATDSAYNDSLRSELIALRRQVSDLETELARQSSSNAAIASNHGDQASTAYQQRGVTAGPIGTPRTKTVVASARVGATGIGASVGGAATAPLGSVDSTYPRVALDERTLGASVTRDSANWNRLHPPTVIVSSISGGAVSNRITPATNSTAAASNLSDRPVVSGDICGKTSAGDASVRTKGSTFMIRAPIEDHLDFRVRSAFREVVKSCPRAFEPHDGTMYVFVFLLDSTGHVTNISINTRRAMKPGETIQDRAALKIGMPDVPITSLYEWGMVDVSTLEQRRGGGVMVMYGFTGILH